MFPLYEKSEKTYWGTSYRLPHIDDSILDLSLRNPLHHIPKLNFTGPNAPKISTYSGELNGNLEIFKFDSVSLNSIRDLYIYTPPENELSDPMPVVLMADGQWSEKYIQIADMLITKNAIKPILIVGIASGVDPNEKHPAGLRGKEYLQGWDANIYHAHEDFFLKEVIPYIEKHFAVSDDKHDRLLHGYSNAAAWVLTIANDHPNRFGHVAASSVSGVVQQDFSKTNNINFFCRPVIMRPHFWSQPSSLVSKPPS